MRHITLSLAVAVAGVAAAFTNPIIPGMYPDPSICRVDSDYYLVNSSFQLFPGVPIWHSRDLVNWTQIGNVLDRPSQLPLRGASAWLGIYAPTIRHNDGKYYMITTNVGNGLESGNFMVTATDPAGPWSEPIWLKQGGIDPSLYFEDGRCYMVSNPDQHIMLCEIDPVTGEQLTPSVSLWQGDGGRHPEAPHIYKRDGWYYLLIAEGGTEMGHSATIARSRDIHGPYESNPDNPILYHQRRIAQANPIQGTGHADLVEGPDGRWWMVCLAFRPQTNGMHLTGRETYLAPVEWTAEGWPVVNGNGVIYTDMDVLGLPATAGRQRNGTVDFGTLTAMPYEWVYLRNPHTASYALTSAGLELCGTEVDLNSLDSPSLVGRRQQDISFTATTALRLTDTRPGACAGITAYMDATSHYDLYLRANPDGTRSVCLAYRLYRLSQTVAEAVLPADTADRDIDLLISGDAETYTFAYSTDSGESYALLGQLDTRYLSTETAGGFTGVILGLYAVGDGTGIFRSFTYEGRD